MSDYTPTPAQVREFWVSEGNLTPAAKSYDRAKAGAEFDRFIAKIKSDALREALHDLGDQADGPYVVVGDEEDEETWVDLTLREWLTIRADRIEGEA